MAVAQERRAHDGYGPDPWPQGSPRPSAGPETKIKLGISYNSIQNLKRINLKLNRASLVALGLSLRPGNRLISKAVTSSLNIILLVKDKHDMIFFKT